MATNVYSRKGEETTIITEDGTEVTGTILYVVVAQII